MYSYEACPTCKIKVDVVMRAKRCRKHGVVEHTKPSGFVKIEISDGTGQRTVTLFDRQVRDITHMIVEELAHYRGVGVNVAEILNELKEKIYLFEIKQRLITVLSHYLLPRSNSMKTMPLWCSRQLVLKRKWSFRPLQV